MIRSHIINNFKGDNYDELRHAIDESISSKDEVTLPGMGVFFELIWNEADAALKNKMLELLKQSVEKGTSENS